MGANIAGIYGAQIFREDDEPRYRRAFAVGIAIVALAICLAVTRFVDDFTRRRRKAGMGQSETGSDPAQQDYREKHF